MTNTELLKKVTSKLTSHELAGRAFDDGCTDGYDVEYVLLAQKIVAMVQQDARNVIQSHFPTGIPNGVPQEVLNTVLKRLGAE